MTQISPRNLIALAMISVGILFGTAERSQGQGAKPVIDCGRDFDCLIRHSATCTPAKVVHTSQLGALAEAMGVRGSATTEYALLGPQAGACRFRQQALEVRVTLQRALREQLKAQGQTDAEITNLERSWLTRLQAEGTDRLTCDLPLTRLAAVLQAIKHDAFHIDSRDAEYCQAGTVPVTAPAGSGSARVHLRSGSSFEVERWWYEGDLLYYERFGGVISVPRSEVDRVEP